MTAHNGGERDSLAPVIPLFGGAAPVDGPRDTAARDWHPTWTDDAPDPTPESDRPADDTAERGEKALLRKLRTRSLSVREARSALVADEVAPEAAEDILDRFAALGYLDDHALAEQLIDKALSRKVQGRQAIAQTLAQRGIPREIADDALSALPDDEPDRALAFARAKAAQMSHLDHDTALRRLAGQLARRGFGSAALSAAKQALAEEGVGTGPRFR